MGLLKTLVDKSIDRTMDYILRNCIIYNVAWEDPRIDGKVLQIGEEDTMLMLTTGGCNVLDRLLDGAKHIVSVDLNVAQNALLELKLAGARALTHEQFFQLFAHSNRKLFDAVYAPRLRPLLSPSAAAFWDTHASFFDGVMYSGASGFLAKAFEPFSRHGVSIDLVSTSETSVTVSLDDDPGLTPDVLGALEDDLAAIARVEIIENCAAVSLVGRGVRALLAQFGPAMEAFAHYPVRLVSQAANDLNLTVVVDADQGKPLCRRLHDQLIQPRPMDKTFGPSWREIGENLTETAPPGTGTWWRARRQALLDLCPVDGATYVYDLETVKARASAVAGLKGLDRGWYAMKANGHPDMIRTAVEAGLGVECVSIKEVQAARKAVPDLPVDRILFTPNFAPRAEYADALDMGVHLTLDGLHPLRAWPEIFNGRKITLRINPQRPEGHHKHVRTAGPEAKFGLHADELAEAKTLAARAGAIINGLHVHSGSGISDPDHWRRVGLFLVETARDMPDVEILDLGGGLSVDEASGVRRIDMDALDQVLTDLKTAHPRYQLWIEPGRYISAESGVLLARVTQLKHTPDARFVGINTGMNSLIRPALYGARHEIVNLTRLDEAPAWIADIVGPICETADRLGAQRLMPETEEGDVRL